MTPDLPPLPDAQILRLLHADRDPSPPYTVCGYSAEAMRAYAAEAVRLARLQALDVADSRRAYESAACAHHAGKWQQAYEKHLTRHAAMVDLMDAVWPDRPTKDRK